VATYQLYEYDRGVKYGPASDEDCAAYTKALQSGTPYILKGHHGYSMRFTVRLERGPDSERQLFGVTKKDSSGSGDS
jgi:hypothetical protein